MTIQQLIDKLQLVEDKNAIVIIEDNDTSHWYFEIVLEKNVTNVILHGK